MNEQLEFFNRLNQVRSKIVLSQDVSRRFRQEPVDTLRQYGLDFMMPGGSADVLFSDYLERISPAARAVILGTIYRNRRRDLIRVDGGDGSDGGDGGSGDGDSDSDDDDDDDTVASLALALAVANVGVVANAIALANAIANANALANANAIANASTVAAGAYDSGESPVGQAVYVSKLSIEPGLFERLEAHGLNVYRQLALIRHAARRSIGTSAPCANASHTTFPYRDIVIDMEIIVDGGTASVVRADVRTSLQ